MKRYGRIIPIEADMLPPRVKTGYGKTATKWEILIILDK